MYELDILGFGPYFAEQMTGGQSPPARIAGEHKNGYIVWSPAGEGFARLSGRLMDALDDEGSPTVGDWVVLKSVPQPGDAAIIDRVLARRSEFTRGAAADGARGQVIAANVDIVFIVTGLDANFNVRRIQRYAVRVHASGARPIALLNKADICEDVESRTAEVQRSVPGMPVLPLSASLRRGLEQLREFLRPGTTAAFVGSSGAGKSTLINTLLVEERLRTGESRAQDGRGRHTTSHREMVMLPSGGLLIDTPGMRELALLDQEGIGEVFSEIEELALHCRFRDCTHRSEPGCAVRRAVERGEISTERVDYYLEMTAEARAYELRHDERMRRQSEKAIGRQRAKDMHIIRRLKG